MKFVVVPYMRQFSRDSENAALASWAAWEQGRFWEMHDLIFENAPVLDRPVLDDLARKLGLDMERFRKAMDEKTHLPELKKNLDLIHELDIWSTPTTIINGRVVKGAQPIEKFRAVIEEALADQGSGPTSRGILPAVIGALTPCEAAADGSIFGRGTVPLYVTVPEGRPTNEPKVGEPAPDFTLPSVSDTMVTLSDFRGRKNVLLTFLPAAFTPV